MSKFYACILVALIFSFTKVNIALAQLRPAIQWQKCLGGTADDRANDVLINADGTMIVVGNTFSNNGDVTGNHGAGDAWIVKLDPSGNIIWQKAIGGNGLDYFKSVIATYDNAYLCIGYTASDNGDVSNIHGNGDGWIVKVSTDGNIISSKCYGGSQGDDALEAIKTPDGNYAILGNTSSADGDVQSVGRGAWVFKINESGDIIWEKCLGSMGGKRAYDLIVSEDNNLYALASGPVNYVGGLYPYEVNLVRNPGFLFKLDNTNGNSSFVTYALGNSNYYYGDSAYAMCRTANATHMSALNESYFYVEFCYDENFYISTKPDGNNAITYQQIGGTFTRSCTNAFDDGQYTAPTHGLAAAETGSGIIAAGSYFNHNSWTASGWLSDISGFTGVYKGASYNYEETNFRSVKVFPNGADYVVVGYTNDNGEDISGNHGSYDCWVVRLNGLNRITGNVFIDANNNNIKDPGELPFTHAVVKSTRPGFEQAGIPYNGSYNNAVDVGSFSTKAIVTIPYYTVTPASKVTAFSDYTHTDIADFAVHPIPGIVDYSVTAVSLLPTRPGFPLKYKIVYTNKGTTQLSNKLVSFVKDPHIQFVNSVPPYTSISGDTIKWNITSLDPAASGDIIVNMQLDPIPLVSFDDTLVSNIYIDSTGDIFNVDNAVYIRQSVSGSYDPNDKKENGDGFITPQEYAAGKYLNYTIRFQNTGNDTAFNITIRDTLDAKLDHDSIELISSSHPCQFNIKNGNYITCTFSDIKLVDSTHNEPLSHGYISYRIKPKSTMAIGDTIRNSASIYFDFNPAVQTNNEITILRPRPALALWTGAAGTAWEDPLNWSNGKVPDANTDIKINNGLANYPVINSNAVCRSLDIKTGATILVKTDFTLKVVH